MDANQLAKWVRDEVDNYVELDGTGALGAPLSAEWWAENLAEMRRLLVPPYRHQVTAHDDRDGSESTREVWIVADDGEGSLLAYDPMPDHDFALVWVRDGNAWMSNILGDAVGCFLAR